VFGYLTEGKEVLEELKAGDKIISAKVIQGEKFGSTSNNLEPPPGW